MTGNRSVKRGLQRDGGPSRFSMLRSWEAKHNGALRCAGYRLLFIRISSALFLRYSGPDAFPLRRADLAAVP